MDASLRFLKAFEPDGDALLRRISKHVDDATLELIAHEDPIGGAERRAIFMNALREIRAGGILKRQSDFGSWEDYYKQDVSELLRFSSYSEPGSPDKGGYGDWSGPLGHWARAFCCAVLLRSYADAEIRSSAIGNHNDAMIRYYGANADHPNHWPLRTTFFDTKYEKWVAIGAELAAFKATGPCGDAVRVIGQRLSGGKSEP